jgi:hypothetical protein
VTFWDGLLPGKLRSRGSSVADENIRFGPNIHNDTLLQAVALSDCVEDFGSMDTVLNASVVFQVVVCDEGKRGRVDAAFQEVVRVLRILRCDLQKERVDVVGIAAGVIRDPFELEQVTKEALPLQATLHFQVFLEDLVSQLQQQVAVNLPLRERFGKGQKANLQKNRIFRAEVEQDKCCQQILSFILILLLKQVSSL